MVISDKKDAIQSSACRKSCRGFKIKKLYTFKLLELLYFAFLPWRHIYQAILAV